jgi:hypothetical protein
MSKYKTQEEARQAAIEAWTKGEISHDEENHRFIVDGVPYEYPPPRDIPPQWDVVKNPVSGRICYSAGITNQHGHLLAYELRNNSKPNLNLEHWEPLHISDQKTAECLERAVELLKTWTRIASDHGLGARGTEKFLSELERSADDERG